MRFSSTHLSDAANSSEFSETNDLFAHGIQQFQQGRLQDALQSFWRVLATRRQLRDRLGEAEVLVGLADSYNRLGKYTEAQELIEQALAIVRTTDSQRTQCSQLVEAEALKLLAIVYFGRGDLARALETAKSALTMQEQLGDQIGKGATLIVVSAALINLGQYQQAEKTLAESIEALEEENASANLQKWQRFYKGETLAWMGNLKTILGQSEQAEKTLKQAFALNRETGNRSYGEFNTLHFTAALHNNRGEIDEALQTYHQSLNLCREIDCHLYEGITWISIGYLHLTKNRSSQALTAYQQAVKIFREIGDLKKEAEAVAAIADIYARQDQYQQLSVDYYEQALAITRAIKDCPTEAKYLYAIGNIKSSLKQYSEAIRAYQAALAIFVEIKNLLGLDGDLLIGGLYTLIGQIYAISGPYLAANESFTQSLGIWHDLLIQIRKENRHDLEEYVLNNLWSTYSSWGNNYWIQRQYAQAVVCLQKALPFVRQVGNQEQEQQLLQQIVACYWFQGRACELERDYEGALLYHQHALRNAQTTGLKFWELKILLWIGQLFTARQNFAQALNYQIKALNIAKELNDRSGQIRSLLASGIVHKKMARYEEALRCYQQAYNLAEAKKDQGSIVQLLLSIGTIHAERKQYEQALNFYQEAQEATQNNPFTSFLDGVNPDNVEDFYSLAQQYSAGVGVNILVETCSDSIRCFGVNGLKQQVALDSINDAVKAYNQTFLTLKGVILHAIAQTYLYQENYNQAVRHYQQAIPILHEAKSVMEGASFSDLGTIYRLQEQYAQAVECCQRGLELSRSFGHRINEEDALYHLAIALWAKGDVSAALEALIQAAAIENETFSLNLAIGSEESKRTYMAGRKRFIDIAVSFHLQAAQESKAAELAFTAVLRRKGRILDAVSSNMHRLRQNLQREDQELFDNLKIVRAELANLYYDERLALTTEEFREQAVALTTQVDELEDILAQRSSEFRSEVQSITVEAVQALISEDVALVEFVRYFSHSPQTSLIASAWGTSRYAAVILTSQGSPKWIHLGETVPIDEAVKVFRDKLRYQQPSDSDLRESFRVLYDLLMPTIQAELRGTRHLLIAPDSQLNLIPFAALLNSQNQYLGDLYTISYLTSGRDLLRLQTARSNRLRDQKPVVVANLNLPGTQIETEAIAYFLKNALILRDGQTLQETLEKDPPNILHIAAHGFFNRTTDNPHLNENPLLRCSLVLAGDNATGNGNKVTLTALEVAGLNLRGTRLVVLSACETGLGGVLDGEGVYGLNRAFGIAGVESQMMSLWGVDDLSTSFLNIKFYEILNQHYSGSNLEPGLVAIALKQAQTWLREITGTQLKAWLKRQPLHLSPALNLWLKRCLSQIPDKSKPFHSPYYWAAFCVIGR